jgi:hypothetical protein
MEFCKYIVLFMWALWSQGGAGQYLRTKLNTTNQFYSQYEYNACNNNYGGVAIGVAGGGGGA